MTSLQTLFRRDHVQRLFIHGDDEDDPLPSYAVRHLNAALEGDVDAVFSLMSAAPNNQRGMIVAALHWCRVPLPAFRAALQMGWQHDHRHVQGAAGSSRKLRAMFRYAAFDLPDLPESITVFRGGKGKRLKDVAQGDSWTLNKSVACWFACVFAYRDPSDLANPIVCEAVVQRSDVLFFSNERNEAEIILARQPDAAIDAEPEKWESLAKRYGDEIRSANKSIAIEPFANSGEQI